MTKPSVDGATHRIADFVLRTRHADLPAPVLHEGRRSLLNILGCAVGGARHTAVDTLWRGMAPFAGGAQATLLGRGTRTDALTASLINTFASSINTFDDTHAEAIIHPSGPVMAAVLAVAERRPATGAEVLVAFTLGVEIACRLSKAVSVAPAAGQVAWSQTGICSGVAAAAASARLLGLDALATRRAIGIAASQAAGIRALHGSMCTAMMPAHAGQTGLRAAFLAAAGFTATEGGLEHRYGLANCFSVQPHLPHLVDGLGHRFEILGNTYKPFPCGIVINPMIDAALQLRSRHRLEPDRIATVVVQASPAALALCDRRHPKDELEGQVSLYHWIAAAFVRGRAGVAEGLDAAIGDPVLVAFRDRITATVDAAMPIDGVDMRVSLHSGETLALQVRDCIGSRGRPMSDTEIEAKVTQLAEGALPSDRIRALIAACWQLDTSTDGASLARLAA